MNTTVIYFGDNGVVNQNIDNASVNESTESLHLLAESRFAALYSMLDRALTAQRQANDRLEKKFKELKQCNKRMKSHAREVSSDRTTSKYLLRRSFVFALYKYFVPKRLNDIITKDVIITVDHWDSAFVHQEWKYLIDAGITEEIEGHPGYVVLSAHIRNQLDNGLSLHNNEHLYGVRSVKRNKYDEQTCEFEKKAPAPAAGGRRSGRRHRKHGS